MALSLNISDNAEKKLRERAAAEGKQPSQYAVELVESAMANPARRYREPGEDELARLRATARRHLQKAREIAPTLTGPVFTDLDKAFEDIMRAEAGRQGLTF
jgi:hypothetical protein